MRIDLNFSDYIFEKIAGNKLNFSPKLKAILGQDLAESIRHLSDFEKKFPKGKFERNNLSAKKGRQKFSYSLKIEQTEYNIKETAWVELGADGKEYIKGLLFFEEEKRDMEIEISYYAKLIDGIKYPYALFDAEFKNIIACNSLFFDLIEITHDRDTSGYDFSKIFLNPKGFESILSWSQNPDLLHLETREPILQAGGKNSVFETHLVKIQLKGVKCITLVMNDLGDIEAQELTRLKSQFISIVSHEFKTPISIIKTSVDILKKYTEKLLDSGIRKNYEMHLERMDMEVERMNSLLLNILNIEKLNQGLVAFKPQSLNLLDYLLDFMDKYELWDKVKADFRIPTDFRLEFDRVLMDQILLNLIENAEKYGSKTRKNLFWAKQSGTQTVLEIRDYGIGIADLDKNEVFRPFFRGSNVGNIAGTGLGLVVVKKFMEILKGKATFSSKLGEGTVFCLTFDSKECF